MSADVIFQGGPADGVEMTLIGKLPSYLLVVPNPASDSQMTWLVVGADFDDHWPGQQRYERSGVGLVVGADDAFHLGYMVYRHVE